jgi:ADP-ribose pyrophosphatase YjhB (NUDIX family)
MTSSGPVRLPTARDKSGRVFTCFPVGILIFVVNEAESVLLLSHPDRREKWEIIKGGLEAGETIVEAALRETREELGSDVRVRPLGTVHAVKGRPDDDVESIGLFYLMAYEGGGIQPGDDMLGSQFRWWRLEELMDERVRVIVPSERWIIKRAIEMHRLWKEEH